MIILVVIIFTILTFYGFMFINAKLGRYLVGGISFIILALSILGLTAHIKDNWGMREVTTSSLMPIYTAGDVSAPYGMLVKVEVGKNTGDYVFVYRTSEDEKKPSSNFVPDKKHAAEAVKKSATYELIDTTTAKVVTTTTRRVFSSSFMETMFNVGGEQNELVKQKSVVEVPKDTWLVLTEAQVTQLTKEAPAMQAQMTAELKANPQLALQMAELQKSDPEAYAAQQVTQIKKLLGITD